MAIFWPILIAIHRKSARYDSEYPDELWQKIYWYFSETIQSTDLQDREYPIASRIYLKLKDSVRDSYRSDWKHQKRLLNIDDDPFKNLIGDDPSVKVRVRDWISYFQYLQRKGLISEIDYHLIIGSVIYGESLHDCAFDLGLTYEIAKKLRQRALKKIRDIQKKLSPNRRFKPLL